MPHTHAPRDSEEALRLAIEFRGLLFLKNEKRISFRIGSPAVLDDADADRVFFERITAVVEPAGERFEVGDGEGEGRSGRVRANSSVRWKTTANVLSRTGSPSWRRSR